MKHGKLSKEIISKTFEETWEILIRVFEKSGEILVKCLKKPQGNS